MDRPDLELKVGDRTIKWTYGLSTDIQRMVPDPTSTISAILEEPFIRDYMVRRVLTDKKGRIEKEEELISHEDMDDLGIGPDEVLKILDWISGQLLYFFASSAGSMNRLAEVFKSQFPALSPSTIGSPASPSTTPSAGPSEPSKAN